MFNILKSKKEKDRAILGIIICVFLLIIGYLVLNFIATLEDPPLGHTIYILIGTSLIAIGGLGAVVILKYLYDSNKKKKRREMKRRKHKLVFLKKDTLEKTKK
jgi:uncharacterized membrane protein YuzA (DUF378 family)